MYRKEKKIASLQLENQKLNLVEIIYENEGIDEESGIRYDKYVYQIRHNRKRLYTTEYKEIALIHFNSLISNTILQQKIEF